MKFLFFPISVIVCVQFSEESIPEDNKGLDDLYQGDILLNKQQEDDLRTSKARGAGLRLWPGGVVPYVISHELARSEVLVRTLKNIMTEWEVQTCIKFKTKTVEKAYIRFIYGKGCYSYVGCQGNEQTVSLGPNCWALGTLRHELGHALGFFHEQARPDRDMYINIEKDNIQAGKESNFDKLTPALQQSWMPFGTPYDYFSIMHFSPFAFTKDKKPTITAKDNRVSLRYLGQRDFISYLDLQQMNLMYNCPGNAVGYLDTICENYSRQIICYGGRKIRITYANYGRKYSSKCGFSFNRNCISPTSLKKVSQTCNGRSSCLLKASDKEFGDPCPFTKKYLAIRYECHP
nr:blastula protease 10-like [Pocillopora verrucosa]